jgi:hypothetical protein
MQVIKETMNGTPLWVRAPMRGTEHYSGLSRSKLYQLARAGRIKTASIREAHQLKGTRLFYLPSVLEYIARNEVLPEVKAPTPEAA